MWYYLVIFLYLVSEGSGFTSPNYFCADMNPQQIISIQQLMGIWYGVEIINHQEERHYREYSSSCPVIHISEDHAITTTTINPLYKNYNHPYRYGTGRRYETTVPQYHRRYPQDPRIMTRDEYQVRMDMEYDKHPHMEMRYLKLYWDKSGGASTEFHLRYNISQPGFWISSGPEVGMPLDPKYSHYAGTVQVLKAVGTHLVLTFCHRLPEHQLYTIILSREVHLDVVEVHSVYRILHQKGLNTNAVKKVCNNSSPKFANINVCFIIILALIGKFIDLSV